jgi:hypothetical protein
VLCIELAPAALAERPAFLPVLASAAAHSAYSAERLSLLPCEAHRTAVALSILSATIQAPTLSTAASV